MIVEKGEENDLLIKEKDKKQEPGRIQFLEISWSLGEKYGKRLNYVCVCVWVSDRCVES